MGSLLDAAGELLLGTCCPGCRRPVAGLCPACRVLLDEPLRRVHRIGLDVPVVAAGSYAGVPREIITAFKEHGVWSLAGVLGERLAAAVLMVWVAHGSVGPVRLVPVPSSRRTVRERGLDTTWALAHRCTRALRPLGLPARCERLLVQRSGVSDQVGLGVADRRRNLTGALRVRGDVTGQAVLLVDDIVTSGATFVEAVTALHGAGARVLGAAAVVETPLRSLRRPTRVPTAPGRAR